MSKPTKKKSSRGTHLLDLGDSFVLSAGTVTLDPVHKKILLLLYRPKGEYLLPKGRKDKGESLADAAVRETFEESGYPCELVAHNLPTLATGSDTDGIAKHMEPISCQQRMNRGTRKIIFWFVAKGDSTAVKVEGTQDEGEDFESTWVDIEQGLKMLSYEDDARTAEMAVKAFPDMDMRAGDGAVEKTSGIDMS